MVCMVYTGRGMEKSTGPWFVERVCKEELIKEDKSAKQVKVNENEVSTRMKYDCWNPMKIMLSLHFQFFLNPSVLQYGEDAQ